MKSIIIDYDWSIYIMIAGYRIRIDFHECGSNILFAATRSKLIKICKGFIIDNREETVDATILFGNDSLIPYINKGPDIYFLMFKERPNHAYSASYSTNELQMIFLLKFILSKLLKKNGFFMHCSAVQVKGTAFIFTGNSGAGKSTISNYLSKRYPLLADDNGVIKKEGDNYYFYHFPSIEKAIVTIRKSYKKYEVANVFFLKKRKVFSISTVKNIGDILAVLTNQTWVATTTAKHKASLVLHFINSVKRFYHLSFPKDEKVVNREMKNFILK